MSSFGKTNVLKSLPSIPTVPHVAEPYAANATRFSSGVSETWHGASHGSSATFVIAPMRFPSSANLTIALLSFSATVE